MCAVLLIDCQGSPRPLWCCPEADAPSGDVISSAVFSLTQSDTLNCATQPVPATKLWQFYYTQQSATNEYYVCSSGQLTTWVPGGVNNAGLLMLDVEGFRNFYVTNDTGFGVQYVFSTGLDGIYGPLEWATNDNYVYPQFSGTPQVLDSNGILMVAAPDAYFTPDWEANFVEVVSNGVQVYEFLSTSINPGTGLTGSMYIWAYGDPAVKSCNTTTPPSPFPANLYFAFRYTITPYYTWDGYWSVCASGIMTTTGWSAQVYAGPIPTGTAYAVIGITGSRQFINNGASTTQAITGLLQPWDDGFSKNYQGSIISNNNMIYPGQQAVDLNGVDVHAELAARVRQRVQRRLQLRERVQQLLPDGLHARVCVRAGHGGRVRAEHGGHHQLRARRVRHRHAAGRSAVLEPGRPAAARLRVPVHDQLHHGQQQLAGVRVGSAVDELCGSGRRAGGDGDPRQPLLQLPGLHVLLCLHPGLLGHGRPADVQQQRQPGVPQQAHTVPVGERRAGQHEPAGDAVRGRPQSVHVDQLRLDWHLQRCVRGGWTDVQHRQ